MFHLHRPSTLIVEPRRTERHHNEKHHRTDPAIVGRPFVVQLGQRIKLVNIMHLIVLHPQIGKHGNTVVVKAHSHNAQLQETPDR